MRMNYRTGAALAAITLIAGLAGCDQRPAERPAADTTRTIATTPDTTRAPAAPDSSASAIDADAVPLTLPVLDAFFADSSFSADLKSKLGLTDQQVTQLRTAGQTTLEERFHFEYLRLLIACGVSGVRLAPRWQVDLGRLGSEC